MDKNSKLADLELNIKTPNGIVVNVLSNNEIEFSDNKNTTIKDLEIIIDEAKNFIEYRDDRS